LRKAFAALLAKPLSKNSANAAPSSPCLAVSGQHVHILAKIPRGVKPRFLIGLGKKNSNFKLKEHGWQGKLWAKRGRDLPVKGRKYQLSVYRYILDHEKEGAWVWHWKMKSDEAQPTRND
jgi:hypothetical protein